MFIVDLAAFLIGSAAQFFVAEAWHLFVIRLVMGMAIGADYAIGWPLLAEFSPARLRGWSACTGSATSRPTSPSPALVPRQELSSFPRPSTAWVSGTMLIAAGICALGAIASHHLAPETKGLSLTEASAPLHRAGAK